MNFQHLISQYGYLAVLVLMLAESACIPIPSEVIMMFGGALAGGAVAGSHPALGGIVAAGVLGNVAGSYLSWAVGKYAGQAVIRRWGRRVGIREHDIDRADAWFERHGPVAVLVGRVVPVIRTFISLPAGFADMPAVSFGIFTTLGCIPWTAALAIAGYALGANWQSVANDFHGPTYVIAGLVVIGLVAAVIITRRRRRAAAPRAPRPSATHADFPNADFSNPVFPAASARNTAVPNAAGYPPPAGASQSWPAPETPPLPGYAQHGYPQPGAPQTGYPQTGYPETAYRTPAAYPAPVYPEHPGYPEPPNPGPAPAAYPENGSQSARSAWNPGDGRQYR